MTGIRPQPVPSREPAAAGVAARSPGGRGRPRGAAPGPAVSLREHVEQILALIRPAIQSDEGDVELVDVSQDGVVRVRFHGACVGCPSSSVTLQQGIEKSLKQHIPAIKAVLPVA